MRRATKGLLLAMLLPAMNASAAVAQSRWSVPPAGYTFEQIAPCVENAEKAEKPARPGAAVYRLCADQMAVFSKALEDARTSGKLLLITFGATWCPWCASLQKQMHSAEVLGWKGEALDYEKAFHHIEIGLSTTDKGQKVTVTSGEAVLGQVLNRTPTVKIRSIPFVAVIDPSDASRTWARNLDDLAGKTSGHDTAGFRAVLREAHAAVKAGTGPQGEPGWFQRKWNRLKMWFS